MIHLSDKAFDEAVAQALDRIPSDFHKFLEAVAVVIEEEPSLEVLQDLGVPDGDTILGCYFGVPMGEKSLFDVAFEPDRIVIYKSPLEELCETEEELIEEIEITVVHEISHHFGIDEGTLACHGYE